MESHWKAWTDATTEHKAQRVAQGLLNSAVQQGQPMSLVRIEPYEKTGGHVLSFTLALEAPSWAETVLELLAAAQGLGSGWALGGSIREEVELTTTSASVPGVRMLLCSLRR